MKMKMKVGKLTNTYDPNAKCARLTSTFTTKTGKIVTTARLGNTVRSPKGRDL